MSYPGQNPGGDQYPYQGGGYPPPQQPAQQQPAQPQQPPQQPSYGPYGEAPISGQPGPAQPMGGGPVSGPVMGPQTSGMPPIGAYPTGPVPSGPAEPRRSPLVAVFASLAVLFLLVTGVMTALYVTKNNAYNDLKRTSAAKEASLNDELTKTKGDLTKTQSDLRDAQQQASGSEAQAKELARQKGVISKCLTLLAESARLAQAGDTAGAAAKDAEAAPICREASSYLD